ncbi:MAG: ABC transporter ATP-binding protein [Deltaproteobacteria bacterium]|nr:ABC transporter ATP-binding protein [Deltaproteobacteria bacterium]
MKSAATRDQAAATAGDAHDQAAGDARDAPATPAPPALSLRGLRKRFGNRTALAGIDVHVTGPQMIGVIGPDGAGKTTLLRAIVGLLEVEADEARVLGFDLRGDDVRDLKRALGYVPQSFSLHHNLTVSENLAFTARLHRLSREDAAARSAQLLARTGLTPFGERLAGALSGGMKQKLAIANALLPDPALLVLDEPTAGVDVVARAEIYEILDERRSSVLIVVSTSYLDEAAGCDRLLYLHSGRLVADGTPAELEKKADMEPYRAWTNDGDAVARAALALPYVLHARTCGRFARIEVMRSRSPGPAVVCRDLLHLAGATVALAEAAPPDLESTLLALSRRWATRPEAAQ